MDLLTEINALSEALITTTEAYFQAVLAKQALSVDCAKTTILQGIAVFVMNTLINLSPEHTEKNLQLFTQYIESLLKDRA